MENDMMDDDLEDLDGCLENGVHYKEVEIREQDRFLPIANIARIMKKILPTNVKVAKDAKEGIQGCISEYISFITSEASDRCQQEKRKTINGDDILWAMGTLGFDKYVDPLKVYLSKYRDAVKGDRPDKKVVARKDAHMNAAQPKTVSSSSSSSAGTSGITSSAVAGVASSVSSHPPRIMSSQPYSAKKNPVASIPPVATANTTSSSNVTISRPAVQPSQPQEPAAGNSSVTTVAPTSASVTDTNAAPSGNTIMSVTPPAHGQTYLPQPTNASAANSSSMSQSTATTSNSPTPGSQAPNGSQQPQFGTAAFPHHLPPPPVHAILPGLDSIWTPSFGLDGNNGNNSTASGGSMISRVSFDEKTPNFLAAAPGKVDEVNAGTNTLMPNVNAYSAFAMKQQQQQQMYPQLNQQSSSGGNATNNSQMRSTQPLHLPSFSPQSNFHFAADTKRPSGMTAESKIPLSGNPSAESTDHPLLLLSTNSSSNSASTPNSMATTTLGVPSPVVKKQKLG